MNIFDKRAYMFERLLLNLSALENEYMALVEDRFRGDWLMDWGELTIIDIAAVYFIIKALKIK